jgi:hypothetical protein
MFSKIIAHILLYINNNALYVIYLLLAATFLVVPPEENIACDLDRSGNGETGRSAHDAVTQTPLGSQPIQNFLTANLYGFFSLNTAWDITDFPLLLLTRSFSTLHLGLHRNERPCDESCIYWLPQFTQVLLCNSVTARIN